jgi:peptide-methionine (S)-S-oxide reductase
MAAIAVLLGAVAPAFGGGSAPESSMQEESVMSESGSGRSEVATLGGGCFWCVEAVYERIDGIKSVVSGYAGGTKADPSYTEVTTGITGHAEVVQVEFDPDTISYKEILELFWKAHDPTTLNRQGADVGTQYRSIILVHDDDQRKIAEQSRAEAAQYFDDPIVTQIEPLRRFYPAEEYHQDYYEKNPYAGYCTFVIRPKLQKLELQVEPLADRS